MTSTFDADTLQDIAARVDAVPSVARRHAGALGTAAAYLPGQRIDGLRQKDGRLEIHVVMRWSSTVDEVEREILSAVQPWRDRVSIDLVIEDVEVPDPGQIEWPESPSKIDLREVTAG